jgi:membrane fusion protein, multidrug efflux system
MRKHFIKNIIRKKHMLWNSSFSPGLLLNMLLFSLLLYSCSSSGEDTATDAEEIRARISENNQRIMELTREIDRLERQLEEMGELPVNRQGVNVSVVELQPQPFTNYIRINSNVEAVTRANISPEINGQIKTIEVNRGDNVRRGQTLIRLNTTVIEGSIEELRTSLRMAEDVYNRQRSLWEQGIGSEMQYLEARNTVEGLRSRLLTLESQLDLAIIRSPINGVVEEIAVKEGELAMPGMPLMQIVNLDQLYVNADVSERYLPVVDKGDDVILRFPAYPDFQKMTPVHRVGNVINPENRTFRLQLRIDNPQGRFKPNMVAAIGIQSFHADSAIVVPSILVKQDLQGHYVYIAQSDDLGMVASRAYIQRGMESEGQTLISSGLRPGDLIISRGHNQVSEGSRVTINNR